MPGSFQATATGTLLPTISRKAGAIPSSRRSQGGKIVAGTPSGTPVAGNGGVWRIQVSCGERCVPPIEKPELNADYHPRSPASRVSLASAGASNTACNFTITTAGYPTNTNVALTSGTLPSGWPLPTMATGQRRCRHACYGGRRRSIGVHGNQQCRFSDSEFHADGQQLPCHYICRHRTCTAGSTCTFSVSARGTNTFALNGEVVHGR